MLIEQRLRAFARPLLLRALGLAATEPRTIGVCLFRRRFLRRAFSDSFQIDDITHAGLHHLEDRRKKERQRRAKIDSIAIQNPRMPLSDSTNNSISLCGNEFFCALARARAMAIAARPSFFRCYDP